MGGLDPPIHLSTSAFVAARLWMAGLNPAMEEKREC
jgi:hypothetical protein